jgi:DNA-binding NarL/FixJ family response regulator
MRRTRVVLADDLPPVVDAITALLPDTFEVVGIAKNGQAALETVVRLEPDLVVLDISMPVLSGIEVAWELKRRGIKTEIVFLTVHEDLDILEACHAAGGLGYVVKMLMDTDLVRAMNEALAKREFTSAFSSRQDLP